MLKGFYEGKTMASLQGVLGDVDEVKTDYKQWIKAFTDKNGQVWLEAYETRGHGEVPSVYSLNHYLDMVDRDFDYARWMSEK